MTWFCDIFSKVWKFKEVDWHWISVMFFNGFGNHIQDGFKDIELFLGVDPPPINYTKTKFLTIPWQ